LVNSTPSELRLSELEFDRKDDWTRYERRVQTTTDARYRVFEEERALNPVQIPLENLDLLDPSVTLRNIDAEVTARNERSENRVG
jgi:hypothetical protein